MDANGQSSAKPNGLLEIQDQRSTTILPSSSAQHVLQLTSHKILSTSGQQIETPYQLTDNLATVENKEQRHAVDLTSFSATVGLVPLSSMSVMPSISYSSTSSPPKDGMGKETYSSVLDLSHAASSSMPTMAIISQECSLRSLQVAPGSPHGLSSHLISSGRLEDSGIKQPITISRLQKGRIFQEHFAEGLLEGSDDRIQFELPSNEFSNVSCAEPVLQLTSSMNPYGSMLDETFAVSETIIGSPSKKPHLDPSANFERNASYRFSESGGSIFGSPSYLSPSREPSNNDEHVCYDGMPIHSPNANDPTEDVIARLGELLLEKVSVDVNSFANSVRQICLGVNEASLTGLYSPNNEEELIHYRFHLKLHHQAAKITRLILTRLILPSDTRLPPSSSS